MPTAKQIASLERHFPQHWVGDGFPVRTLFSYGGTPHLTSPFLLLDYAGPHEFPPSTTRRGVGEHPHRGFETVTIVTHGELEHRDSAGNHGRIGPGDVQWMTAASGVVHEEFHSEPFTRSGGLFELVQLWVNLPASHKMSPPRYQEITAATIPKVALEGNAGTLRVIAGNFRGTQGPANTVTPIDLWQLELTGETTLELVPSRTALMVVEQGSVTVNGDQQAAAVSLVRFEREGSELRIEASEPARLLILSGEPIDEPVVGRGPFVMNTADEIRQAMADFQEGKMGRLT